MRFINTQGFRQRRRLSFGYLQKDRHFELI